MSRASDFFNMTRRERRGTIVLLALVALAIALTAALRTCDDRDAVALDSEAVEQFEAQIDSVRHQQGAPAGSKAKSKKNQDKKKKKSKRSSDKKSPKAPTQPRRLDPVPQF